MVAFPGLDVHVREERREDVVVGQRRRTPQVAAEAAADAPAADFRADNVRLHEGVSGGDTELPAGDAGHSRNTVKRDAPRNEPVSVVRSTSHQDGMRYKLHPAYFGGGEGLLSIG